MPMFGLVGSNVTGWFVVALKVRSAFEGHPLSPHRAILLEEPARHARRGPLDDQPLFRRVDFDRRNYKFDEQP